MNRTTLLTILAVTAALVWSVGRSVRPVRQARQMSEATTRETNTSSVTTQPSVDRLNAAFEQIWNSAGLEPTTAADDLTILRRLSIALHGTIPSLEEIRQFEAEPAKGRLDRWCEEMLADRRFAESFAERMTRAFVGTQGEPFLVFRRDRFKAWWAEQLAANRPYDEIVREVIAGQGLWTGKPATNFITHSVEDGTPSPAKLAARTVRTVLGQRIDCAECHDHPFADWKQEDFRGLAAFFGQVKLTPFGVEDDPSRVFMADTGPRGQKRGVQTHVPFGEEWLSISGTARDQLALWCVAPENRRFARATVNRIWALMFGKPLSAAAPWYADVDNLPDPVEPTSETERSPLDILADEFVASGHDLQQLIRLIAASRVFRLSSVLPMAVDKPGSTDTPSKGSAAGSASLGPQEPAATHTAKNGTPGFTPPANDESLASQLIEQRTAAHVDHWAVFPVERLRSDQVVGSMLQASSVRTIDLNSALLTRMIRFIRENDFLREYGDAGDEELLTRNGTVPQALVRMNGRLVRETIESQPFNATTRIGVASMTDEELIDSCFLICLTRRPTETEREFFLNMWKSETQEPALQAASHPHDSGTDDSRPRTHRSPAMKAEDLCWVLINSPEFSWNH
jgi:hypothetical protein